MAESLTTMALIATLYATGLVTVPESRMSVVEPIGPGGNIVVAQGSCGAKPAQCRTGMPANQLCKRTTAGQPAGLIWITCSAEGLPQSWKPTPAPCTCNI